MCQKQPTVPYPPRKNTTHMLEIPTPGKKKIETKSSYCQKIIFFFLIQTSLNTMQLFLHSYPLLDMNNLANGSPIWPIFFSKMMSSFFFKMVPKNDKIFFFFSLPSLVHQTESHDAKLFKANFRYRVFIKFQKKFHHFHIIIIILIHLINNHLNSSYNSDRGVLD